MDGLQRSGAFVVQFRTGSDFQAGRVEGRVEHIASGQTGCFHSTGELLALLDRGLTASRKHAVDGSITQKDTRT
jgi:hypothetical protein